MTNILKRKFSTSILEELHYSIKTNGIHKINFFTFGGKFITYTDYVSFKSIGYDTRVVSHIGFKHNFNYNFSVFTLFTSEKLIYMLGLETPMQNIGAPYKTASEYVNPFIFIFNPPFATYFTLSDVYNEFPLYVKNVGSEVFVDQALATFI